MPYTSNDFVSLLNGPTLPREVIHLAIDLELKGLTLHQDGDKLSVHPRELLTADDIEAIQRWKLHLLALLAYKPPKPMWVQ